MLNDHELDQMFRDGINKANGLPPQVRWNPESTFTEIDRQLHTGSKSGFFRINGIAASIGLLLIAGFTYISQPQNWLYVGMVKQPAVLSTKQQSQPDQHLSLSKPNSHSLPDNKEGQTSINLKFLNSSGPLKTYPAEAVEMPQIINSPKKLKPTAVGHRLAMEAVDKTTEAINKANSTSFKLLGIQLNEASSERFLPAEGKHWQKDISVQAGFGTLGAMPNTNMAFTAAFSKPNSQGTEMGLSVSAEVYGMFDMNAERSHKFQIATFATTRIGWQKPQGNRHSFGLGVLLNNPISEWSPGSLKLDYSRTIGNKINISPEVIITRDFKWFTPGIKITFG